MTARSDHSAVFGLVSATLMIAHQITGKATRDGLFLSRFDIETLPKMVMLAAVVSFFAVLVMSRLIARFGPARVMPLAFGVSAAVFVAIFILDRVEPRAAAVFLYLHMSVFGAVLISGFWSLINERFDPHAAKRQVARIAAAATLGGVVGGLAAERLAGVVETRSMLLVLAALHLACTASVRGIGARETSGLRRRRSPPAFRQLVRRRYLSWMAALTVLVAVGAALLDYAFKAAVTAEMHDSEALVGLFARFYALVGLATFVLQSLLGPTMLRRYGIGVTLAVLPVMVCAGGLVALAVPRTLSLVLLRGGQSVLWNSFFRSAFELLYTPLPIAAKRPTKALIDVAADRAGDLIGGALTLGVIALAPFAPVPATIAVAVLVMAAGFVVVLVLHRGYVEQLADSLRDGAISLAEGEILDATTRHTFAETTAGGERAQLLARIRAQRQARLAADGVRPAAAPEPTAAPPAAAPELAAAVAALGSGDLGQVRRCLGGEYMDDRLVVHLVPLLAEDALAEDVRMELRWMAPRVTGALTDALLDPDLPVRVRQRIPGVLEVTHHPRSVAALLAGLDERSFNVRFSCARALARMAGRDADLRVDSAVVHAAVAAEVTAAPQQFGRLDVTLDFDLGSQFDRPSGIGPAGFGLEYVFTLLSLVHDRHALQLAFQALVSEDPGLRGTALEYLENVLPEALRRDLWPHLGVTATADRTRRPPQALLADLRRLSGLTRARGSRP